MPKTPKHKGFLLVEAMISITILLMVSATAITLLIYANQAIRFNAHSLEASWIAQEGINGFRGLRDTNWIRYSYDKEKCWDATTDVCDGTIKMDPDFYRLETSLTGPPQMSLASVALDLENGIQSNNDDYRIYVDETDGSLSHDNTNEPTIFYRQIEIQSNDGSKIEAVVTVAWLEGQKQKTIDLPATITNYQLEE